MDLSALSCLPLLTHVRFETMGMGSVTTLPPTVRVFLGSLETSPAYDERWRNLCSKKWPCMLALNLPATFYMTDERESELAVCMPNLARLHCHLPSSKNGFSRLGSSLRHLEFHRVWEHTDNLESLSNLSSLTQLRVGGMWLNDETLNRLVKVCHTTNMPLHTLSLWSHGTSKGQSPLWTPITMTIDVSCLSVLTSLTALKLDGPFAGRPYLPNLKHVQLNSGVSTSSAPSSELVLHDLLRPTAPYPRGTFGHDSVP